MDESEINEQYLSKGRFIGPALDLEALDWIRERVVEISADVLKQPNPNDIQGFLETIHQRVSGAELNEKRLEIIFRLCNLPEFNKKIFLIAKQYLEYIVGNELAIQKRINLSIQMPDDVDSLLSVHADTWSGDSAFEAVVWVPLVNCEKSMSMYLLPPNEYPAFSKSFSEIAKNGSENVFLSIESKVEWIKIDYGQVMIFDQTLPHGNRVNKEASTRWSINCRFKAVFSPYKDKKLGEFFEPISLRPASIRGLQYEFPIL